MTLLQAQKCRTLWEQEVAKCEELEKKLQSVQSGYMLSAERTSGKCGSPESSITTCRLTSVVGEDGASDASSDTSHEKQQAENLICPRCDREFPCTEKAKWELHCRRCRDE